jgi:hypothetical protein
MLLKNVLLAGVCLAVVAAAPAARAQTVANFDNPVCNGSPGIYQGINFTLGPWDCEYANLSGDATKSISWSKSGTQSAQFSFVSPSILISLQAGGGGKSGLLTISTDAGETFSTQLANGIMSSPLQTGFSKLASVVTVSCSCSWAIELDNITYSAEPAPPAHAATVQVLFDDGTPVSGLVSLFKEGATETLVASATLDSTGTAFTDASVDPTQAYRIALSGSSNNVLAQGFSVPMPASLSSTILSTLASSKVVFTIVKATGAIKSMALAPL